MSNPYQRLSLPGPGGDRLPTMTLLAIARKEFNRYIMPLATIFAGIAMLFLLWGMLRPSTYQSSATVLVQDNAALAPLMEGRAAPQNDASQAAISRDLLFGREVMEEVFKAGGWNEKELSPLEKEQTINSIIGNTDVSVTDRTPSRSQEPRLSLVKITYSDSDPERAYAVARRFSEALIEEVLESRARSSESAYQFINAQVEKYQQALAESNRDLLAYRSTNPDALPGVGSDVSSRIAELRRAVDNANMDLADLGAQERQLMGHLARESQVVTTSRSSQGNAQLATLQAEEARLMLSYTDQHPDVVSIRHQIQAMQAQIRSGRGVATPQATGNPTLNPVYSQLRTQLAQVRSQGAAAASRVATAQALLQEEHERNLKIVGSEADVAALTRAQGVNQEIYEDLLKRRENARVSMRLDEDGSSLGFQIQEPATLPLQPTGLRLMHFAAAGLLLAILVPGLLLAMLVKHDPRTRSPLQIERQVGLPVLASVPLHYTPAQSDLRMRRMRMAMILFSAVILVYGVIAVLKLAGAL